MATSIFISHSSRNDERAQQLRLQTAAALKRRGYKVFLDDQDLSSGDLWRPKIYRALSECEGAVLLFTPDALASRWVVLESTILAHRRDLRVCFGITPIKIVPVLLGTSIEDLQTQHPEPPRQVFEHLRVDDSQAITDRWDDATDVAGLAVRISEEFDCSDVADDAMRLWMSDVAERLREVSGTYLDNAARFLLIPKTDWSIDDGRFILSSALLFSDKHQADAEGFAEALGQTEKALAELLSSDQIRNKRQFIEKIMPGCLPYDSTKKILEAFRQEAGDRVVFVNAKQAATAERLIRRATCCNHRVFIPALPPAAESEDDAYRDVLGLIAEAAGMEVDDFDAIAFSKEAQEADFQIVIMLQRVSYEGGATGNVLRRLLGRLRRVAGPVLFVVVTGDAPVHADEYSLQKVLFIDPPLEDEMERRMTMVVNRLRANYLSGEKTA